MIYLRAGLYAEGPSDYEFLGRLLDRLIDSIAASLSIGAYEVADTIGIDAPKRSKGGRAEKVTAAIVEYYDTCVLFVIHADSDGDREAARANRVEPGILAARAEKPSCPIAACIPVRETEAWMLADVEAFRVLLGATASPALPEDPERELEPKATLRRILREGGSRRSAESIYALFGERVRFEKLRALPAFQAFESELTTAIREVAEAQGHRA